MQLEERRHGVDDQQPDGAQYDGDAKQQDVVYLAQRYQLGGDPFVG